MDYSSIPRIFQSEYGYNGSCAGTPGPATGLSAPNSSIRSALFAVAAQESGAIHFDEVDRFCQVILPSDTNIIAWFRSQRNLSPVHFLAAEKHSMTASSTAVERANSEASHRIHKVSIISQRKYVPNLNVSRSWKKILKIPDNRREAANQLHTDLLEMMEDLNLSNEWEEELLEEGCINNTNV